MTQQHRRSFWFALLLGFPLAVSSGYPVEARLHLGYNVQEPPQSQGSSEAIAEAAQLTRTVVTLFGEGQYEKALPLAKRALELRETALGPDHELVQVSLLNLAEIYTVLKKHGEALKLVERLLTTYEQKVGPEDAGTGALLDKLGFLAYLHGDFQKSETAYKRALAIREKTFGQDSAEFAKSLYSLAEFYRFRKKPDKAEPLYAQAVILRRKLFGKDHPEYVKARVGYLCLAFESGDSKKVKEVKEELGYVDDPSSPDQIINGRALSLPRPAYSDEARRQRAMGIVVISVSIDEQGRVIEAKDLCGGNPLLVRPSLESARAARFQPTMLSGQPVKFSGVITYRYVQR